MSSVNSRSFLSKPIIYDLGQMILFGVLSFLLGLVQFQIPGFDGGFSDLREIPLIISLFYISNPLYIIGICTISALSTPENGFYFSTLFMHLVALLVAWYFYKRLEKSSFGIYKIALSWAVFMVVYYYILLFPAMIFADRLQGLNNEIGIIDNYVSLIKATRFEIVTSTLVIGLFAIQFEVRKDLEIHKNNLESIVERRTAELEKANSELRRINELLTSNNEEIKMLNENLDELVKERSKKVQQQLRQLKNYANMNSHQVRAPLARILGLLGLLKMEKDEEYKILHMSKLFDSSQELDDVIKKMNRLLETEVH